MKGNTPEEHLPQTLRRRWFTVLAFCLMLTPNIYIRTWPAFRLEQVVVLAAALAVILGRLTGLRIRVPWSLFPKLLAGFALMMLISIGNAYRVGLVVLVNDYYELFKVAVAVGIFLFTAGTIVNRDDKVWAMGLLHGLIVVSALISIAQFYDVGGLNALYVPYIAPTQYEALMAGYTWPRVVGLTGNPNRYAAVAALGALLGLVLLVRKRQPHYLLTSLLCVTALLMTRSRAGFIFLGVILLVWIIAEYTLQVKGWLYVFLAVAGVGGLLYALMYLFPDSLTWRLKRLFNLAQDRSWQIRLRVWTEYFWAFMDHPLLGSGPGKGRPLRYPADNEWLFLLKRYGLLGTSYLTAAFVVPVQRAIRPLLSDPAGPVYIAVLAGTAVFMIPAGVFHSYQGLATLSVCAGLAFSGINQ
jgi:hypothetical protein